MAGKGNKKEERKSEARKIVPRLGKHNVEKLVK